MTGPDGAPVTVQVTSGGGRRPVIVVRRVPAGLVERLARAGFATVTIAPETPAALDVAIAAIQGGALGVEGDRCALVEPGEGGSIAVARIAAGARTPGVTVGDAEAVVSWLVKHVV